MARIGNPFYQQHPYGYRRNDYRATAVNNPLAEGLRGIAAAMFGGVTPNEEALNDSRIALNDSHIRLNAAHERLLGEQRENWAGKNRSHEMLASITLAPFGDPDSPEGQRAIAHYSLRHNIPPDQVRNILWRRGGIVPPAVPGVTEPGTVTAGPAAPAPAPQLPLLKIPSGYSGEMPPTRDVTTAPFNPEPIQGTELPGPTGSPVQPLAAAVDAPGMAGIEPIPNYVPGSSQIEPIPNHVPGDLKIELLNQGDQGGYVENYLAPYDVMGEGEVSNPPLVPETYLGGGSPGQAPFELTLPYSYPQRDVPVGDVRSNLPMPTTPITQDASRTSAGDGLFETYATNPLDERAYGGSVRGYGSMKQGDLEESALGTWSPAERLPFTLAAGTEVDTPPGPVLPPQSRPQPTVAPPPQLITLEPGTPARTPAPESAATPAPATAQPPSAATSGNPWDKRIADEYMAMLMQYVDPTPDPDKFSKALQGLVDVRNLQEAQAGGPQAVEDYNALRIAQLGHPRYHEGYMGSSMDVAHGGVTGLDTGPALADTQHKQAQTEKERALTKKEEAQTETEKLRPDLVRAQTENQRAQANKKATAAKPKALNATQRKALSAHMDAQRDAIRDQYFGEGDTEFDEASKSQISSIAGNLMRDPEGEFFDDPGGAVEEAIRQVAPNGWEVTGRWDPSVKNEIVPKGRVSKPGGAQESTRAAPGRAPAAPSAAGKSKQQLIDEANDAIKRGADPAKVRERLKGFGVELQEPGA